MIVAEILFAFAVAGFLMVGIRAYWDYEKDRAVAAEKRRLQALLDEAEKRSPTHENPPENPWGDPDRP